MPTTTARQIFTAAAKAATIPELNRAYIAGRIDGETGLDTTVDDALATMARAGAEIDRLRAVNAALVSALEAIVDEDDAIRARIGKSYRGIDGLKYRAARAAINLAKGQ